MSGAVYICGGQRGTARTRDPLRDLDGCPNTLHDWPLPTGYGDAADEAGWRLRNHWRNVRCPECKRYGWIAGKLTDDHVRRPVEVVHQ